MKTKDIALLVVAAAAAFAVIVADQMDLLTPVSTGVLVVGLGFYFLPTIIAVHRQHRNTLAIAVLNILAGWTFVGWIGAIVWSLLAKPTSAQPTA